MSFLIFANNAASNLLYNMGSSDVSLQVQLNDGTKFPNPIPANGEYAKITVEDRRTNQIEIMHLTSRFGDVLNVVRAQEGTTAQAFLAGASVSNRITRDTMAGILSALTSSTNSLYLGPHATAPTTDNVGGPLQIGSQYYDTIKFAIYVYTGTVWESSVKPIPGGATSYIYHASGGQTDFTGVDLNGNTLACTWSTDDIDVYVAGLRKSPGDDYATSTNNHVVLNVAPSAGTHVQIDVIHPVVIAIPPGTYVQVAGDTMAGPLAVPAGATGSQVPRRQEVDAAITSATAPLATTAAVTAGLAQKVDTATFTPTQTLASNALPKSGGTLTGALVLAADPAVALAAATKQYVDAAQLAATDATARAAAAAAQSTANAAIPKAGGTMTGTLVLAAGPTNSNDAASKSYVDGVGANAIDSTARANANAAQITANAALPVAGGIMTGALQLAADPVGPLNAATKQYVDATAANPVGTVIHCYRTSAPSGYFAMNGQDVSQITYANLWNAMGNPVAQGAAGTFRIPNVNGQNGGLFIRGQSGVLGAIQAGMVGPHTHGLGFSMNSIPFSSGIPVIPPSSGAYNYISNETQTDTITPAATENRPANIALLACIKH